MSTVSIPVSKASPSNSRETVNLRAAAMGEKGHGMKMAEYMARFGEGDTCFPSMRYDQSLIPEQGPALTARSKRTID